MTERSQQTSLDGFVCDICGEKFDTAVWHCEHCDHHYSLAFDQECGNCHEGKRPH